MHLRLAIFLLMLYLSNSLLAQRNFIQLSPYVGWSVVTTEQHLEVTRRPSYAEETWFQLSGYTLGARIFINFTDSLFSGINSTYSQIKGFGQGHNNSQKQISRESKFTQAGAFLGYRFSSIPVSFWGEYCFLNKLTDTGDYNKNGSFKSSSGYKFGLGMEMSKNFSINLEYVLSELEEDKRGSLTTIVAPGKEELRVVLISFQLNI